MSWRLRLFVSLPPSFSPSPLSSSLYSRSFSSLLSAPISRPSSPSSPFAFCLQRPRSSFPLRLASSSTDDEYDELETSDEGPGDKEPFESDSEAEDLRVKKLGQLGRQMLSDTTYEELRREREDDVKDDPFYGQIYREDSLSDLSDFGDIAEDMAIREGRGRPFHAEDIDNMPDFSPSSEEDRGMVSEGNELRELLDVASADDDPEELSETEEGRVFRLDKPYDQYTKTPDGFNESDFDDNGIVVGASDGATDYSSSTDRKSPRKRGSEEEWRAEDFGRLGESLEDDDYNEEGEGEVVGNTSDDDYKHYDKYGKFKEHNDKPVKPVEPKSTEKKHLTLSAYHRAFLKGDRNITMEEEGELVQSLIEPPSDLDERENAADQQPTRLESGEPEFPLSKKYDVEGIGRYLDLPKPAMIEPIYWDDVVDAFKEKGEEHKLEDVRHAWDAITTACHIHFTQTETTQWDWSYLRRSVFRAPKPTIKPKKELGFLDEDAEPVVRERNRATPVAMAEPVRPITPVSKLLKLPGLPQHRERDIKYDGSTRAGGRRKTATAHVRLTPGPGRIVINKTDMTEYFEKLVCREMVMQPFYMTERLCEYDVYAKTRGGGIFSQAEAIRLAISRALQKQNPSHRLVLKRARFLRRDHRMVERKKPGQAKARKKNQWSKR